MPCITGSFRFNIRTLALITAVIVVIVAIIACILLVFVGRNEMVTLILLREASVFVCVLIEGEDALHQLHCDALVGILRVWNALMVLAELERELLLICLGLLVNGRLYEFLALHSVGVSLHPFGLLILFRLLANVLEGRRLVHLRRHLR